MTKSSIKPAGPRRIAMTRIQKIIAKRMMLSEKNKACFYIRAKMDVAELMKMRRKLGRELGTKITSHAFYIRALAKAVLKYPLMVGKLDGDSIKIADSVNIGFAVNAPQGLVVPVLKDAQKKSLMEISKEEQLLIDRARSNKLTLDDITGETIAMSNLGAYDIDSFLAIIPPPASAIVAIGNTVREVVPRDGLPQIRKQVVMSLAVDYRITVGTYAAQFLNLMKQQLENPHTLI